VALADDANGVVYSAEGEVTIRKGIAPRADIEHFVGALVAVRQPQIVLQSRGVFGVIATAGSLRHAFHEFVGALF
jgi:hypothetical protein